MNGNNEDDTFFELMTIDKKSTIVIHEDGSLTIVGDVFLLPGAAKITSSKVGSFQYSDVHRE